MNLLALSLFAVASSVSQPVKVAILDTGLDLSDRRFSSTLCSDGHTDLTHTTIKDTNGHGTHIAGLIQQYAKNSNYCLIIVKYWDDNSDQETHVKLFQEGLRYASTVANYVNISGGGPEYNTSEREVILSHPEVTYILAAGNNSSNIDKKDSSFYPASYNLHNTQVVGALTDTNEMAYFSNYGSIVKYWELGVGVMSTLPGNRWGSKSGSSMSTAIHTGKIIYDLHH